MRRGGGNLRNGSRRATTALPRTALLVCATTLACAAPRAEPAPAPPTPQKTPEGPASIPKTIELPRKQALELVCTLLDARDRDCDRRITVLDEQRRVASDSRPEWPYVLSAGGAPIQLRARHEAAQFVQESVLALRDTTATVTLDLERIRDDPVSYLAHRIREHAWSALTRRIDSDPEALARAAADTKLDTTSASSALDLCPPAGDACTAPNAQKPVAPPQPARQLYAYYPESDPRARAAFEKRDQVGLVKLLPLPKAPDAAWVLSTTRAGRHGLLTLALDQQGRGLPFVVPGGRFNELYGWDSYFIVRGLLEHEGHFDLARAMVENQAYEIEHYSKILNANRTYYLTRSQPPFFASTLLEVSRRLGSRVDTEWLARMLRAALREYRSIWTASPRRLELCDGDACLSRYFDEGRGEPPEVEPGHFVWFYQAHALAHGHCTPPAAERESQERFVACAEDLARRYRAGTLKDAAIDRFFANDRAMRESGHDTTFRWFDGEDRCSDFATVDLNALIFKYEVDLATLIAERFDGKGETVSQTELCERARARSRLVKKYLWDERRGLFFDYDTKNRRRSSYLAATTLYPLWASTPNVCGATLVDPGMARALRDAALPELEAAGGLMASAPSSLAGAARPRLLERTPGGSFESRELARQWEAPNGWAPHQLLAVEGLRAAGFTADAERLQYRWLYTIAVNSADYHGTVPEKFDVKARSHAVFAEYGNVNTDFAYISDEGFGWMNASFVVGLRQLEPRLRSALEALTPPERLF
jgi:alpha,alpha-trehalase